VTVLSHPLDTTRAVTAGSLATVAVGELLVADGHLLAAAVVDAALVLALAQRLELAALALVPLARLLSLVAPLGDVAPAYWNAIAAVPLGVALVTTTRALGLTRAQLGLVRAALGPQLAIAATGVPLGLLAYLALRPAAPLAAPAVAAIVGAAVVEEVLFRGTLQQASGAVVSAVAYAVLAIAGGSAAYVAVAALAGAWFSYAVARRRCLWGVLGAHALAAAGAAVVWPIVL
jgi:hypothetical protein